MDNHKGMLISIDLLVAMPIALAAASLLLLSIDSSLNYQYVSSAFYIYKLNQYLVSQQLVNAIDEGIVNYSNAGNLTRSESILLGFKISVHSMLDYGAYCTSKSICRIVEVKGNSYILVIRNETTN